MGKPGLDNWKRDQIISAAWDSIDFTLRSDLLTQEDEEDFRKAVIQAAEQKMTRARDLGTEIHGAINNFLSDHVAVRTLELIGLDVTLTGLHSLHVKAALCALKELGVWGQPFESEKTFGSVLGYGGTVDIAGSEQEWIFDFKAINTLKKRYDWPDRCAQIAAYQMGKYGKLCRGGNIILSTEEPGAYAIKEWCIDELEYGWSMFTAAFELWKISNRYRPELTNQAA